MIKISSPVLTTGQVQVKNWAEACPFQYCGINVSLCPAHSAWLLGKHSIWDRQGGALKKKFLNASVLIVLILYP